MNQFFTFFKLSSFCLALCWAQTNVAQIGSYSWAESLRSEGDLEQALVAVDGANNTYVAFESEGAINIAGTEYPAPGDNGRDVFLIKYDPNGSVLWSQSIVGPGSANSTSNGDLLLGLQCDETGNVYLIGHHNANALVFGNAATDERYFVLKASPQGDLSWINYLQIADQFGDPTVMVVSALYVDDNSGEIFVGGRGRENFPGEESENGYVFRYDADGAELAFDTLANQHPNQFALRGDTLIVSGQNANIIKLASYDLSTLDQLWLRESSGGTRDYYTRDLGLFPLDGGDILHFCRTRSSDPFDFGDGLSVDNRFLSNGMLWRVGADGRSRSVHLLADQLVPPTSLIDTAQRPDALLILDVEQGAEDEFYLFGELKGPLSLVDGGNLTPDENIVPSNPGEDALVLRVDTTLTVEAVATQTGTLNQRALSGAVAPDGDLRMVAEIRTFRGFGTNRFGTFELPGIEGDDLAVVKFRPVEDFSSSIFESPLEVETFRLLPNPTHGPTTIELPNSELSPRAISDVKIFNALGNLVYQCAWPVGQKRMALLGTELRPGTYLVVVLDGAGMKSGAMLLVH